MLFLLILLPSNLNPTDEEPRQPSDLNKSYVGMQQYYEFSCEERFFIYFFSKTTYVLEDYTTRGEFND